MTDTLETRSGRGGATAERPREVVPVRSGAVALWLAGPLLTFAVAPHPTILDGDVGGVVVDTTLWGALHLSAAMGIVLGWWGLTCTVWLHRARLEQWAAPIFVMSTLGAFVLSAVMVVEAFAFPVLAHHAPGTLELDGPIFASWPFRVVSSLGGGFFVGLLVLGWALSRRGIWPAEGRALALTTVAFMVAAGAFVPVLGVLSTIALAVAAARVGLLLWRQAPATREPVPSSQALDERTRPEVAAG